MKKVAIIGAGAIGICCALELRKRGMETILLDPNPPATQASYGNAGIICTNGIAPYASPQVIKNLVAFGLNKDPRFLFHWPHFFHLLPWLTRFLRNCNASTYQSGLEALNYISHDAVQRHGDLLKVSGAQKLINRRGWLRLYRTHQSFAASKQERKNYQHYQVPFEEIDSDQIRQLEPSLKRRYEKGILLSRSQNVSHPKAIFDLYFEQLLNLGGVFQSNQANEIVPLENGWQVSTSDSSLDVDGVVIAAGANSPALLNPLGIRLPMAIERGYHLEYQLDDTAALSSSLIDMDKGLVFTPMQDAGTEFIRVTSAVNLIAKDTRSSEHQITSLIPEIESVIPIKKPLLQRPWIGHRPSTPDSLPIIGPAANQPGLFLAYGHGHLGITLAPKTAELIAQHIFNEPVDPHSRSFLPTRF